MRILNQDNIDELNKVTESATVLYFSAAWCGPCKTLSPQIEQLSGKFQSEEIVFFKVNADDEKARDLLGIYNVRSIPTLIFIKAGKEMNRLVGASSISVITGIIDAMLEFQF